MVGRQDRGMYGRIGGRISGRNERLNDGIGVVSFTNTIIIFDLVTYE